jgi:hypothetical protein
MMSSAVEVSCVEAKLLVFVEVLVFRVPWKGCGKRIRRSAGNVSICFFTQPLVCYLTSALFLGSGLESDSVALRSSIIYEIK